VARFMGVDAAPLTSDDVVLCSGGSGALEMALTALVGEGDNVLVPKPGFPLYQVHMFVYYYL
jgi:tyrosine aminotransferase